MEMIMLGIPLAVVIAVLYQAATKRRGSLVVLSWLLVPALLGIAGVWGTWAFMDAHHIGHHPCGQEDYLCDEWPPMAFAHLLLTLVALGGPAAVTVLWIRERRSNGSRARA